MATYISGHVIAWWNVCALLTICAGRNDNPCSLWPDAKWFAGYCYVISKTTLPVSKAKISCEQMHQTNAMKLAEPRTDQQYDFLKDMSKNVNSSGVLLGGGRVKDSDVFVWSDGSKVNNWWYKGQPNNAKLMEDCIEISISYRLALNDFPCNDARHYACEKYIGDPCESVLAGSEYMEGSCFKLYNTYATWRESLVACQNDGGFLAEPISLPLLRFLLLLIKITPGQSTSDSYYLGASDEATEGTFRWLTTGEPITFNYWGEGEPSNISSEGQENYLTIKSLTKRFNDDVGKTKAKFFCQKNIMKHEYLIVVPSNLMLMETQLMITSPDQNNSNIFYRVSQRVGRGKMCGTFVEVLAEVAVYLEPTKYIQLDTHLGMSSSGIFDQYVKVESSQELTVVLSRPQDNLKSFSFTATLVLNIALLKQNYFLIFFPHRSGQLTMTAIHDGTDVILKVPVSYRSDVILGVGGMSVRQPAYITFTLEKYQTAVINTTELGSGFISANQAIAVYSFTEVVQEKYTFSNYVADIIIPVELMSSEYVTFPSWLLTPKLEKYQILAIHDNTNVVIYGNQTQSVTLPKSGYVHELSLPGSEFFYMKSDIPFQAKKAFISAGTGTCVSPLLPLSLWHTKYVLFAPSNNISSMMSSDNIKISSVLFLISEHPNFDISYPANRTCLNKIEGTNMTGCIFEIFWEMLGPVYITNNGTKFAAYATWITESNMIVTCYPLGMDISNNSMENFDGLNNINFNETACNTKADIDFVDIPESTVTVMVDATFTVLPGTMSTSRRSEFSTASEIEHNELLKLIHVDTVDYRNTSEFRRSKTSAADVRISSIVIGLTGVTILTIITALFIFSDILSFIRFLMSICQKE